MTAKNLPVGGGLAVVKGAACVVVVVDVFGDAVGGVFAVNAGVLIGCVQSITIHGKRTVFLNFLIAVKISTFCRN